MLKKSQSRGRGVFLSIASMVVLVISFMHPASIAAAGDAALDRIGVQTGTAYQVVDAAICLAVDLDQDGNVTQIEIDAAVNANILDTVVDAALIVLLLAPNACAAFVPPPDGGDGGDGGIDIDGGPDVLDVDDNNEDLLDVDGDGDVVDDVVDDQLDVLDVDSADADGGIDIDGGPDVLDVDDNNEDLLDVDGDGDVVDDAVDDGLDVLDTEDADAGADAVDADADAGDADAGDDGAGDDGATDSGVGSDGTSADAGSGDGGSGDGGSSDGSSGSGSSTGGSNVAQVTGLPSTGAGESSNPFVWPLAAAGSVLLLIAGHVVLNTVKQRSR